ncbi:MAG TPA: hypothetical protein VK573_12480 [Gemmatimonadales bacterium]|nr:hypothetical protein [Gemmatimonadales bacterium]
MFDEAQYLATLVAPTYKARDGKLFVGVILSADEVAPLEARLRGCGKDWGKTQAAMRAVTEACFPRPWYKRFGPNPVWAYIKKLPPPGQAQAVWSFTVSLASALGLVLPSTLETKIAAAVAPLDGPHTAGS